MASRRLSAGLMPLVVLLPLLLNDLTQPVHICRHASQYAFLLSLQNARNFAGRILPGWFTA